MATTYDSLWEIGAIESDGTVVNRLGDVVGDKKCVMVVNVAAHSHHSKMNFEALNDLYAKYESFGFEVLAFPSNQFGHKDTMSDHELRELIEEQWNVAFPIFHKVKVNGQDTDEVFRYLRSRTPFFVDKRETP